MQHPSSLVSMPQPSSQCMVRRTMKTKVRRNPWTSPDILGSSNGGVTMPDMVQGQGYSGQLSTFSHPPVTAMTTSATARAPQTRKHVRAADHQALACLWRDAPQSAAGSGSDTSAPDCKCMHVIADQHSMPSVLSLSADNEYVKLSMQGEEGQEACARAPEAAQERRGEGGGGGAARVGCREADQGGAGRALGGHRAARGGLLHRHSWGQGQPGLRRPVPAQPGGVQSAGPHRRRQGRAHAARLRVRAQVRGSASLGAGCGFKPEQRLVQRCTSSSRAGSHESLPTLRLMVHHCCKRSWLCT